jgi:hypothetical protein
VLKGSKFGVAKPPDRADFARRRLCPASLLTHCRDRAG